MYRCMPGERRELRPDVVAFASNGSAFGRRGLRYGVHPGRRALDLFAEQGIEVAVGAPREEPEMHVKAYLAGTLQTGENVCDH